MQSFKFKNNIDPYLNDIRNGKLSEYDPVNGTFALGIAVLEYDWIDIELNLESESEIDGDGYTDDVCLSYFCCAKGIRENGDPDWSDVGYLDDFELNVDVDFSADDWEDQLLLDMRRKLASFAKVAGLFYNTPNWYRNEWEPLERVYHLPKKGEEGMNFVDNKAKEMKLMDLAKLINEMEVGEMIDFATGTIEDVESYGGWCSVKRIDEFDNDNPMYLVGHWGGEANVLLYHLSEYDHRIGDFCEPRLSYRTDESNRKEKDWVECCARMIADFLEHFYGGVTEIMTVEIYKSNKKE